MNDFVWNRLLRLWRPLRHTSYKVSCNCPPLPTPLPRGMRQQSRYLFHYGSYLRLPASAAITQDFPPCSLFKGTFTRDFASTCQTHSVSLQKLRALTAATEIASNFAPGVHIVGPIGTVLEFFPFLAVLRRCVIFAQAGTWWRQSKL